MSFLCFPPYCFQCLSSTAQSSSLHPPAIRFPSLLLSLSSWFLWWPHHCPSVLMCLPFLSPLTSSYHLEKGQPRLSHLGLICAHSHATKSSCRKMDVGMNLTWKSIPTVVCRGPSGLSGGHILSYFIQPARTLGLYHILSSLPKPAIISPRFTHHSWMGFLRPWESWGYCWD